MPQSNARMSLGGNSFWVQNGAADWSIASDGDLVRFEVRHGDRWNGDPDTRERSEIAGTTQIANGKASHVAYAFAVETGARNTAQSVVLGQFHQDEAHAVAGNAPPFSIGLAGERMVVTVGYTNPAGVNVAKTIYADGADIVRGQFYKMDVQVTFDPSGAGHLTVTRDGLTLVDYLGPLGYVGQAAVYWKEGIYRAEAPEALAADFKGLGIATTDAGTAPAHAGYSTVTTYDPVTGARAKVCVVQADGSKTVADDGIKGQSYTSDLYAYDAKNVLLSLTRFHADGTFDYRQALGPDSSTTVDRYDAAGVLKTDTVTQIDGTVTTRTFAANGSLARLDVKHNDGTRDVDQYGIVGKSYGSSHLSYDRAGRVASAVSFNDDGSTTTSLYGDGATLSKSTVARADHSADVYLFGITGRTYVSERDGYDASGTLVTVVRTHADGTRDYAQTVGPDRTVTTSDYDATGRLTRTGVVKPDGSRTVDSFNITGQAYTFTHAQYDAAGVQLVLQQFHADHTLAYMQMRRADGTATSSTYGATGLLSQQTIAYAGGASVAKSFDGQGLLATSTLRSLDGSTDFKQFDAAGHLVKEDLTRLDGSRIVDTAYITGRVYASAHAEYDAAGVQTLSKQIHADGTLASLQVRASDGSNTVSTYDPTGHLTQTNVAYADASTLGSWYGASGRLTQTVLVRTDGSSDARLYDAAGQLTKDTVTNVDGTRSIDTFGIVGKPYASQHMEFDARNAQTALIQYHADGTKAYSQVLNPDGSLTTSKFDAAGTLKSVADQFKDGSAATSTYGASGTLTGLTSVHADGSKDVDTYAITGKLYTQAHWFYDAAGALQFSDTSNTDGTHTVTLAAANVTVAATGRVDIFNAFGSDTFAFSAGSGADVIAGFHPGAAAGHDTIQLDRALAADFAHLDLHQVGRDTVIGLGGTDSITLKGVAMASLTGHDFLFV